ncbi:uncharacterized protein AB675_4025 [Cyphellophora attinorum]|uniref:Uncharacterized protein n=1 Tax=Cyphellophora attinorum TaxID=1664694 RepID=A0A0N1NZ07_9EURO|nr:uncharacterized protein AB675_4025 [Phialophora attinorum]KPI37586.1 hypothetical protein AB675_4025 [Phialophora attinorum]
MHMPKSWAHMGCTDFYCLSGAAHSLSSSRATRPCSGLEFFEPSSGSLVEAAQLSESQSDHSLQYMLPDTDLENISPDMQRIAWHAINIVGRRLDKGRIHEAATFSNVPSLIGNYHALKAKKSRNSARGKEKSSAAVENTIHGLIVDIEIRVKMHLGRPLEPQIKPPAGMIPACATVTTSKDPFAQLQAARAEYRQTAVRALTLLPDYDTDSPSAEQYADLCSLFDQLRVQESSFAEINSLAGDKRALIAVTDYQIEHLSMAMILACHLGSSRLPDTKYQPSQFTTDLNGDSQSASSGVTEYVWDTVIITGICRRLLQVFSCFTLHASDPESETWTRSFAAYSAATIMCVSLMHSTSPAATDLALVETTMDYFRTVKVNEESSFTNLAHAKLEELHAQVTEVVGDTVVNAANLIKQEVSETHMKTISRATTPVRGGLKRKRGGRSASAPRSAKRTKAEVDFHHQPPSAALDYGQVLPTNTVDTTWTNLEQPPRYPHAYESSVPTSASSSFGGSSLPLEQVPTYYIPVFDTDVYLNNSLPPAPEDSEPRYQFHPPELVPWPPREPSYYLQPQSSGYWPAPSRANDSAMPAAAQLQTPDFNSPMTSLQQSPWQSTQPIPQWTGQPHPESRRSSSVGITSRMTSYVPEFTQDTHFMSSAPYQHIYGGTSTHIDVMGKSPEYYNAPHHTHGSHGDTWVHVDPAAESTSDSKAATANNSKSELKPITANGKQSTKPLWSQIMARPPPPAPSSTATAPSAEANITPASIKTTGTVDNAAKQNLGININGSTPGTHKSTTNSDVPKRVAPAAKQESPVTPTMTKDQALALPTSHFVDRVSRTNDLIEDIYNSPISLSAAARKHGFASAEDAGVALAVFAHQSKRLLQSRRVYKDTMLLTMAKDKDGYSGQDIGELYTEAWNERKEQDKEKQVQGVKRNEGQLRARQRDREMKREGPTPGLNSAANAGRKSIGSGRKSAA